MILSKTTEYAIRALLYMVVTPERQYIPVKEISERQNISPSFLSKIVQRLTVTGILSSHKGPLGGVALGRPANQITLLDVVAAIDGLDQWDRCVIGLRECDESNPCPLHREWVRIREQILQMFSRKNLEELAQEITEKGLRIRDIPKKDICNQMARRQPLKN